MKDISSKRAARRKTTAEDFTPASLVNQMLDKLVHYGTNQVKGEDKTVLDPACGNGNMLVEMLKRKLSWGHNPAKALGTLYGCDIMRDNVRECRLRLLATIREFGTKITKEHIRTVHNHIAVTPLKNYARGSLDYDFSFPNKVSSQRVEEWYDGVMNKGWLDNPTSATIEMNMVDENMEEAQEQTIFD